MIKTFEQYNEMDPYGEEIWEDEEFKGGDLVVAKKNGLNVKNKLIIARGETYKIGPIYDRMKSTLIYNKDESLTVAVIDINKLKEYFDKK